jgi:UDP-N-acetyl-D-mannosaminuronate dehydrogenase
MSATDQNQKRHNQQYQDMLSPFNKILVIGLGQLGFPVPEYVKERGFDIYGYDSSANAIDRAEKIDEMEQQGSRVQNKYTDLSYSLEGLFIGKY